MNNEKIGKVSIIVPAYNAERYLKNCLDSLIQQTYKNIEILLINDGSTDSTGEICDTYQRYYEDFIKAIHGKHGGVSSGRLEGIRRSTGEYVVFVDADDWIESDYIASMVSHMSEADIVAAGITRELVNERENTLCEYNGIPAGRFVTASERKELYGKMLYCKAPYQFGVLPYLCNKIFRKTVMRELLERIDKRIFDGEDAAIVYQYLLLSCQIVLIDECKYHYVNHSDSTSMRDSEDAYLNASYLYQELYACFVKNEYCADLLVQLDHYMRRMIWKKDPAAYLQVNSFSFPYDKVKPDSRIILYGMGKVGETFYKQIEQTQYCTIAAWADRTPRHTLCTKGSVPGIRPEKIRSYPFDYIVIAIENKIVAYKISENLLSMGIDTEKIVIPDL